MSKLRLPPAERSGRLQLFHSRKACVSPHKKGFSSPRPLTHSERLKTATGFVQGGVPYTIPHIYIYMYLDYLVRLIVAFRLQAWDTPQVKGMWFRRRRCCVWQQGMMGGRFDSLAVLSCPIKNEKRHKRATCLWSHVQVFKLVAFV